MENIQPVPERLTAVAGCTYECASSLTAVTCFRR
jgi:hypothetical protein